MRWGSPGVATVDPGGKPFLGSSLAFIDGTVVNLALPALQANFGATVTQMQWVVESYALLLTSIMLAGGSLGDIYGRKRIFIVGVVVFAAASAWCGLASKHQRIDCRALPAGNRRCAADTGKPRNSRRIFS